MYDTKRYNCSQQLNNANYMHLVGTKIAQGSTWQLQLENLKITQRAPQYTKSRILLSPASTPANNTTIAQNNLGTRSFSLFNS